MVDEQDSPDAGQKFLGAPSPRKRKELEQEIVWDRDVQSVAEISQAVVRDVRRVLPGITMRVVPIEPQVGVHITCEFYSSDFTAHDTRSIERSLMKDKEAVRQCCARLASSVLRTLANKVDQLGGR